MTESEARTKPVSEVWKRLSELSCYIDLPKGHPYFHRKKDASMLRAVLLGRCELLGKAQNGVLMVKYATDADYLNAEMCQDLSAAYAFWAWELKQRQDESNGR